MRNWQEARILQAHSLALADVIPGLTGIVDALKYLKARHPNLKALVDEADEELLVFFAHMDPIFSRSDLQEASE